MVVGLVYTTPNLRSPTNLLLSSTCLSTLFFSTVATCNTVFFYTGSLSADWSCRVQGYLTYVSICLVVYSYVAQAMSRLFWTVLYKHKTLLTMKSHLYMVLFQVTLSFLLPTSALVTTHIVYRPFKLCLISSQYKIHSFAMLSMVYVIPILVVIILYVLIFRHIRRSSTKAQRSQRITKRDGELARNILILFGIFLFGGVPATVYTIIPNDTSGATAGFYLVSMLSPAMALTVEKIVTVILNREIRTLIKHRCLVCFAACSSPPTRVEHFSQTDHTNKRMDLPVNLTIIA